MKTEYKTAAPVPIEELTPYSLNAKTHDDKQIRNIAQSIKQFGFTQPLVIDKDGVVIIGHGRLLAAKQLGLAEVPCIRREDLSEEEIRELRILDNKLNESAWDSELLANDLDAVDLDAFDLSFDIFDDGPGAPGGDEPQLEKHKVSDDFMIVPFSIIRRENETLTKRRDYWERRCNL